MKTTQRGFIAPLLLLITAVLLAGGIYIVFFTEFSNVDDPKYQTKQKQYPRAVGNFPTVTSTTRTTDSQTAVWKTYENTKYGFSLRYPSDWKINDQSFTYQGENNVSIEIESPIRNIPDYKLSDVQFSIQMHFKNGEKVLDHIGLIKAYKSGDQAVTRVTLSSLDLIAADGADYKLATQIFDSAVLLY